MGDLEAQARSADAHGLAATAKDSHPQPPRPTYVPWRDRIKYFSWQWYGVVTATAVTSSLVHIFPYHNDSQGLKIVALVIFFMGLVVFFFNAACIIAKAILYPKEAHKLITDPGQSSFSGFVAVGGAGLIEGALNANLDWGTGHTGYLYALWGLWWLDAALAYFIGFGVIYSILGQKSRSMDKVMPIWIIPVVALIASSTCGGLLGDAIASNSHTTALVSTAFAVTMLIVGLTFTTIISWSFLLRLLLHGAPDAAAVFATFNTLTPLGQGGFSLLINGNNLSKLVPTHLGSDFPESRLAGQMLFSVCFCFSYILWCTGIAWIVVSMFAIGRRANKLPQFTIVHWSIVFPNGVFALCSVQLGNVLENRFYKGFGAAWSIIVFMMWTALLIRSIPAFINGTMFLPPVARAPRHHHKKHHRNEKGEKVGSPVVHIHEHDDTSTLYDPDHPMHMHEPITPPAPKSSPVPHPPGLSELGPRGSPPPVTPPEPALRAENLVTVQNAWSSKVKSIGPRKLQGVLSRRSSRANVSLSQA